MTFGSADLWGRRPAGAPGTRRAARLALRALAGAALLALTACTTTPAPAPPIEWLDYRIGAPDALVVNILPEPTITETVTVRPDGMITVPLVGDVLAGGRTTREVAEEIEQRISRYKRGALVTVSLAGAASSLITVLGEVNNPQTFELTRQMRVSEALGTAGDITYLANSDEVRVVRPGRGVPEVLMVDMDAIRGGDLSTNVQLYGGDIIYVPPTPLGVFGYLLRQLLFPFDPLLGVARAAGGAALVR